ncbi:hypothetical protein BKA83DRAFT_4626491, partial [Pisolithus microcarpus]
MQEQSSPSSSQTPIPSRARPEAVEGQLPGSRATRPLSSQPLAPSRAQPETHEGRISSLKMLDLLLRPFESPSRPFELPSRPFKRPSSDLRDPQDSFELVRVMFELPPNHLPSFESPSRSFEPFELASDCFELGPPSLSFEKSGACSS